MTWKITYLWFDDEVTAADIHLVLLWIILPLVMLDEEDYLWGQASRHTSIHLIARQHEVLGNLEVIWLILSSCVDAMEVAQSQQPCTLTASWFESSLGNAG